MAYTLSYLITSMRGQNELHTIVYQARVSEEARVVYTYLYREQLYIYSGQSPYQDRRALELHRFLPFSVFSSWYVCFKSAQDKRAFISSSGL